MKPYLSKSGRKVFAHINELNQTFLFHLSQLDYSVNEEDIHYLRRASKRLKALYKLLGSIDKHFNPKKRFKLISKIFESAGALREIQVNQKLLLSYGPSQLLADNYATFFKPAKKESEKKLKRSIAKFKIKNHQKSLEKIEKICRKLEINSLTEYIAGFLAQIIIDIKMTLSKNDTHPDLHVIRILIKKINPILILIDLANNKPQLIESRSLLKNAEDKLGSWHDRFELLQSVREMLDSKQTNSAILDETKTLIYTLEKEQAQLYSEAKELVKTILDMQTIAIS
jgi:CHAD domain-containing protein